MIVVSFVNIKVGKRYKQFVTDHGLFIRLTPRDAEVENDFDGITFLLKKKEGEEENVAFNAVEVIPEYACEFPL